MDKDRKKIIDRRSKGRLAALGKDKGKYTEDMASAMETSWILIYLSVYTLYKN